MDQEARQKLVEMFKSAVFYEELNLVQAQNQCMRDFQRFVKSSKLKQRGEEILNKLILDSLNHALVFANMVIKIYKKDHES